MILLAKKQLPEIPRILCDNSLEDSTHWLRAAGYDVSMPYMTMSDRELLELADKESRLLIINEKLVNTIPRYSEQIIVIKSDLIYEQIREISKSLDIDWTYRPFSRCMICNSELMPLNINQWLKLPEKSASQCVTSHGCTTCNRIYWAGEQIDRMVGQLKQFNENRWVTSR